MRVAAAVVVAAAAVTAAAPLATAAPSGPATVRPAAVADSGTPELTPAEAAELERLVAEIKREFAKPTNGKPDVSAFGGKGEVGKKVVELIKKAGPKFYRAAVDAAKGGTKSFNKWVDDLKWYHPVRVAISAGGGELVDWLVGQLMGG
ncbi:hypothetical protein [Kitasatospora purpeofusca]|uniref:hypothetical protein n=1 Tax=Kitasatospora purpeofusca TaxID=67352 RepID=UPI003F4AE857